MAEIKNSFLRSKMNKDLDDRLIPNGEYRDAQNISVGKSEDDDIGALETILGNTEKIFTITPALPSDIQVIGYLCDEYLNTIFVFATNYTDANPTTHPTFASSPKRCVIYSWTPSNPNTAKLIADGIFLNFSTTNPIQASLIENLLFFTDNRNQPRKVNINQNEGYYTLEQQISVAKYNPYTPISLLKKASGIVLASPAPTTTTFGVSENANILIGMSVMSMSTAGVSKIASSDYITVSNVSTATGTTTVTLSDAVTTPVTGDIFTFLISTMTDQSAIATWPGDPDFLEDKYVRFSYRYRFDDGEYSIFAPFTQIAYIPKQKGYFKNQNEDEAYRSTILTWMENNVNNIELLITLPENKTDLSSNFKIESLDILYKESDGLVVKVLETIPIADIQNDAVKNIYTYEYQSRKPYKTLTQAQTTRVYDKVPVRSLSQETAGNRIIYGNFRDAYSAPDYINYDVKVIDKGGKTSTSWVEYPNHSLKQNRNYQVGFILADKFGRQSPVILSPVSTSVSSNFLGSTIFSPYNASTSDIKAWFGDTIQLSITQGISSGFNSLQNFSNGEPGLYAIPTGSNGFAVKQTPVATIGYVSTTGVNNGALTNSTALLLTAPNTAITQGMIVTGTGVPSSITIQTVTDSSNFVLSSGISIANGITLTFTEPKKQQYTFTLDSTTYPSNITIPTVGSYLRGEYTDFVIVESVDNSAAPAYVITTDAEINQSYLNNTTMTSSADIKFAYTLNPTGWYSYKVVVKQQEQDYYNVYLPGILMGYPDQTGVSTSPYPIPFPGDPIGSTSNIVLINDNINKVPRDLAEVGPDQKQFRSSVQLFGRVENTMTASVASNIQFFPGTSTDTAISIATTSDSNMEYANLSSEGQANIYQIDSKPLIARLATDTGIGVISTTSASTNMIPFLAIYETEPVDSLLDIFWETSTIGLIADLNADVATGYDGPTSFTAMNYSQPESKDSGDPITDWFYPQSNEGTNFDSAYPTTAVMTYTSPRGGTGEFILEQDTNAASGTYKGYRIKTNSLFKYITDSAAEDVYTFSITVTVDSGSALAPGEINTIQFTESLTNVVPSFVNTPPPSINITVDETGDPFTGQDTSAVNGTSSTNTLVNKIDDLRWSILSGNPTGLNGQPSFEIDETNGNLSQTANNTPNGQHTLVLKIEDAWNFTTSTAGTGSLSATANQGIFVGPEPANAGIKSSCVTGPIDGTAQYPNQAMLAPWIGSGGSQPNQGKLTGVWYIAASALGGGYTSGTVNDDIPITPSTDPGNTAGSVATYTLFRLGTQALTQGTLVLSLNAGLQWASSPPPSGLQGTVTWKVWHRTSGASAWAEIADINNETITNASGVSVTLNTANTGTFDNFYNQIILAFDALGEYTIAAVDAQSVTANQSSQGLTCWVNSNDLHYSTCVIEDGTNVTGGTAQTYEYGMSGAPTTSYNCSYGFNTTWSGVPYGQYVPQFFTTSALSTPYTFADAGSGISNYYAYKPQGGSPFDDASSYRYTFSTRFTSADGKLYKPDPWAQCYIQNCGTTAVATSSCTHLQMEYPY